MLVAELAEFGVTMAASTIHRVLLRRGISRLRDLDVTGQDMREKPKPHRYEHPCWGDMVHVDMKKMGGSPTAVGGGCPARAPMSTGPRSVVSDRDTRSCTPR